MAALDDLKLKTAELLEEGRSTGTLTPEEYQWRRGHLDRAVTVDDLEALVADLLVPETSSAATSPVPLGSSQMTLLANRTFLAADLGPRTELVTLLGSTRIDLSDLPAGRSVVLELAVILGETTIVVPPGVRVRVEATPIMGDCQVDPSLRAGDATVRITGAIVMGSLRVFPSSSSGRQTP